MRMNSILGQIIIYLYISPILSFISNYYLSEILSNNILYELKCVTLL